MSWHPIAAVIALAAGVSGATAQAPPAPTASAIDIINLEREQYERMTVPVTIGGEGPFRFMIDTGAQATVLSRALADELTLQDRKTATLVGMASARRVETTPIEEFQLGSRSFYIRQAPIVEGETIGGADGILGLDSLQNQRVLLDFRRREIFVDDAEQLGGNAGYEIVVKAREKFGQLIITSARLDGIDVDVVVDTGAQGSVGNMALLERLRARSRDLGETEMTDVNGHTVTGPVRVGRQLDIGRASVQNFAILFADSQAFHSLGLAEEPTLILGMEELKLFRRVAIDFKTRRVLFDLPHSARPFDSMWGGRMGV